MLWAMLLVHLIELVQKVQRTDNLFTSFVFFLTFSGLEKVRDFGKFRNLQIVWLNGNKVTLESCRGWGIIS